jgi:hypothetical protein
MTTDTAHRPSPQFRDYLEGEVIRGFRRERGFQRLRRLAVVIASLTVGATAGLASAQIREGAQRDSLLESATADMSLAATRLELARAQHADVSKKVKLGILGTASLAAADAELRHMEAAAARARLNMEEIRATSMPPRDDLNAPLVGARDFVTERIQLDLAVAQRRLTATEEALAEADRRARVGAGSDLARFDAELEVARARAALGVLAEQRKLRKEFVEQGTPAEQLARRLQHQQLRLDAMVAGTAVEVARQRLELIRKQRAVGVVGELEQLKAEVELKEREAELASLARRLKQLRGTS